MALPGRAAGVVGHGNRHRLRPKLRRPFLLPDVPGIFRIGPLALRDADDPAVAGGRRPGAWEQRPAEWRVNRSHRHADHYQSDDPPDVGWLTVDGAGIVAVSVCRVRRNWTVVGHGLAGDCPEARPREGA